MRTLISEVGNYRVFVEISTENYPADTYSVKFTTEWTNRQELTNVQTPFQMFLTKNQLQVLEQALAVK